MEAAILIGAIVVLLMLARRDKRSSSGLPADDEKLDIRLIIELKEPGGGPRHSRPRSSKAFESPPLNATELTHGLIIDEPWISKILNGEKCWEMRSTRTKRRGPIALIKKGSKTVVGLCELTDVHGPFDSADLERWSEKHRVPASFYETPDYKWRYAWELSSVHRLESPIPYQHKTGSVIWVVLDENALQSLSGDLSVSMPCNETEPADDSVVEIGGDFLDNECMLRTAPYDRDGYFFCPRRCLKQGRYCVVSKFGELEFTDYDDALEYLSNMDIARWKGPGPDGSWKVVTAAGWKALIQD